MVNIRIYGYSDTFLVIFFYESVLSKFWDLLYGPFRLGLGTLRCICDPNFRSTSLENSPVFLFVCLFVWLNKNRTDIRKLRLYVYVVLY